MDNNKTVKPTSQMSSEGEQSRSEGHSLHDAQIYSSTPARNMGMRLDSHSVGCSCCKTYCQNGQQSRDLRDSQMPSHENLNFNESMQQNIREVGFENIFGSNCSNSNMPRLEDSVIGNQPDSRHGTSRLSKGNYEQESLIKNEQSKHDSKEKKSITTKTFAKGMMDVSLLTSNATQLRAVLSNQQHEFYSLLLWLIILSVTLQILSSVLLLMSDYFKTDVKEKDRQNQKKRKFLNFLSIALVTVVTSLNILISVFSTSSTQIVSSTTQENKNSNIPEFTKSTTLGNRAEL